MPTLSLGGGSHLGVSYSGALLSRAEWEGEKKRVRIIIQKTREYLEGGNQVSSKSSPLQGIKAQPGNQPNRVTYSIRSQLLK